jgi:hypothetical protein
MKQSDLKPIVIADLRGGRNGTDPPMALPFNQCTEALNIDWKDATLAHKRGGSIAVSQTGGTAFSLGMQTLERHVPGNDETAAELWGIDGAATPIWKRLTGGTSWANVTVDDAVSSKPQEIVGVALNGKRFFAYDSTVDRLHVYDPTLGSPRVRRVSFATPAAPTVANVGAGAYAAVLRYYRVRWLQLSGTTIIRRSEPGASVSFTPSGTGTAARITQPTVAGEGETHWEIERSSDNTTWYRLFGTGSTVEPSPVAIATTTDDDSYTAAQNEAQPVSDAVGMHSRFPSVKFLMTDGNRLLGGGAWESAGADSSGKNSRIWFTPVLGSADKGDDERVPNQTTQKNWVDLNENDGGALTGGGGPLNGVPWWFKYRQVWKLRPTGDVTTPYLPRKVRNDVGCIAHKTLALGEDQHGDAALYFLSHRGPYRVTINGEVQYLGRDNEDIWRTMNLGASTLVAHSTYYPDLHQWWLWIATGASNDPDTKMMLDVQRGFPDVNGQIRGGWAKHTSDSAGARCSCLFSNTLGASMSRDLKPHIGRSSGTVILKCDTTDTTDNGTNFQAYATTRPLLTTGDLMRKVGLAESTLIGKATAGSDVTVTIERDFGRETRAHGVSLAPAASETRVVKKVEGSEMGEADVIQLTIGDSAANTEVWTVDAMIAPVIPQETR